MKVINKKFFKSDRNTYDLTMQKNHNYMVTYDDIIVHNSGKSFVVKNVLGIDAKALSTDDILPQLTKFQKDSDVAKEFKKMYNVSINDMDLGNPEDCEKLHDFVNAKGIAKAQYGELFQSIFGQKHKPNLIFDVTLKKYPKIEDISGLCMIGGYDPKNVHLVLVLNKFETAKEQNAKRDRKVPEEGLLFSHKGCAEVMKQLLTLSKSMGMIDGDIWIYFGSTNTGDTKEISSDKGGRYIEDFCAVKIKEAGKKIDSYEEMMNTKVKIFDRNHKLLSEKTLKDKINEYIPEESDKF